MNRRNFVKSALAAAPVLAAPAIVNASAAPKQEYYELRKYTLKTGAQQKLVEDYFRNALIPAAKKAGLGPVGLFKDYLPPAQTDLYAVLTFPDMQHFIDLNEKLNADQTYLAAGEAYLKAPISAPAYEYFDSALLKAFSGIPKLEVPPKKDRLFELRRYESPTETAGRRKIDMFNVGEFPIFRRAGLNPVFFGDMLSGQHRPNLTYMIVFDDMAGHDAAWEKFGKDPDWKALSGKPEYQEIVSRVVRTFLVPVEGSEI
ncbi:MAG: NIPSNAP family protein [Mucilaginibacter polytrichastri]|nr:NIPSNAP family protein [Mucilaginibacter polytrichastri]